MIDILPYKTAITRKVESKPMREFVEHGLIAHPCRVLDYGCGRGADVRWLQSKGIAAQGWDPHLPFGFTETPSGLFDVVTLLYVVNILPSRRERRDVVAAALNYVVAGGVLAIVSRTRTEIARGVREGGWPAHGDGYLSSAGKGTFQKGHDSRGLEELVDTLPVRVMSPVFRASGYAQLLVTKI